jgi:hypothetical protein
VAEPRYVFESLDRGREIDHASSSVSAR